MSTTHKGIQSQIAFPQAMQGKLHSHLLKEKQGKQIMANTTFKLQVPFLMLRKIHFP